MNGSGDGTAAAERQMRVAEARVARQAAFVARHEAAGGEEAERAREFLALLHVGLALARVWVALELASPDNEPSRRIH